MKLILASNSPRRRALLKEMGVEYEAIPSSFEERGEGLSAEETVLAFARGKAADVFSRHRGCAVLGADTVVCLDGEIIGKPKDKEDAKRMLRRLSGRTHTVYTGLCLLEEGFCKEGTVATRVRFRPLADELIERYVESELPLDKAGAYGIQDGYDLVASYEGSYTNVVGFPVETVRTFLKEGNVC